LSSTKDEALATYERLVTGYREEAEHLRVSNAELSDAKAALERRLTEQAADITDAAARQVALLYRNLASIHYITNNLRVFVARQSMLVLVQGMAMAYRFRVAQGQFSGPVLSPVDLEGELDGIADSLAGKLATTTALVPRVAELDRYQGLAELETDPLKGLADDNEKERLDAVFERVRDAFSRTEGVGPTPTGR
jgi:hypothetical protein